MPKRVLIAASLWASILSTAHADELSEINKAHELIQGEWKCKSIVDAFPGGEINTIWTISHNKMIDNGTYHFSLTIGKVTGSADITGPSVDKYEFISPNMLAVTALSTDEKLTNYSKNLVGRIIRDEFFVDYLEIKRNSIAQADKVFIDILLLTAKTLITVDFEPSAPDEVYNLRQCTRIS